MTRIFLERVNAYLHLLRECFIVSYSNMLFGLKIIRNWIYYNKKSIGTLMKEVWEVCHISWNCPIAPCKLRCIAEGAY